MEAASARRPNRRHDVPQTVRRNLAEQPYHVTAAELDLHDGSDARVLPLRSSISPWPLLASWGHSFGHLPATRGDAIRRTLASLGFHRDEQDAEGLLAEAAHVPAGGLEGLRLRTHLGRLLGRPGRRADPARARPVHFRLNASQAPELLLAHTAHAALVVVRAVHIRSTGLILAAPLRPGLDVG